MRAIFAASLASGLVLSGPLAAQGINNGQDCDRALILSTYSRTDQQFIDYRMAEHVDQQAYEEVRNSAGANATIYGVPIGANWSGFRQNIQTYRHNTNTSLTLNTFRNVAWTGLGANALAAYTHCLNTIATLERRGVRLLVLRVSERDVIVQIRYTPQIPAAPAVLPLEWSYTGSRSLNLPREIASAGELLIIVPRPALGQEDTLLVNSSAGSAEIGVTGLPVPLPPPTRCEITAPLNPVPQLAPHQQTLWRCSRLAAGDYRINVTVSPTLANTAPIRAHYSLAWQGRDGTGGSLSSGVIDVGVSAGIPTTANGSGSIKIPEGHVDIIFRTGNLYCHCDFSNGNYGAIVPSAIRILVEQ